MKSSSPLNRKQKLRRYEILTYTAGAIISIATLAIGILTNLVSSLLISEPFSKPLASTMGVILVLAIVIIMVLGLLFFLLSFFGVKNIYLFSIAIFLSLAITIYGLNIYFRNTPSIISTLAFSTGVLGVVCTLSVYLFFELKQTNLFYRFGFSLLTLFSLIGSGYIFKNSFYQPLNSTNQITFLVASFDSSLEDKYKLTDYVVEHLRSSLQNYPDVQIVVLPDVITEEQGSDYARKIGREYNATAVVWGQYSLSKESVIVSLRFDVIESLKNIDYLKVGTVALSTSAPVSEFQNLSMQNKITNDVISNCLFIIGLQEYSSEDWTSAVETLTKALEMQKNDQPENAYTLLLYRGNAYATLNQYESAVNDFSLAISLDPTRAEAYRARALVFWKLGNNNLAQADNSKALSIEPENYESYIQRGSIYLDQGKYDSAISDFTKAITINSSSDVAYIQRGIAYSLMQEYQQSIADFSQAIQINPTSDIAYVQRGWVYSMLGDYEISIDDLSKAIALNPSNGLAYFYRGTVYIAIGNNERAIQDLEKSYDLVDDPQLKSEILDLLNKLKQ